MREVQNSLSLEGEGWGEGDTGNLPLILTFSPMGEGTQWLIWMVFCTSLQDSQKAEFLRL